MKVLTKEHASALVATDKIKAARVRALYLTNRLHQEYGSIQGQLAVMVNKEAHSQAVQHAFQVTLDQSIGQTKPVSQLTNTVLPTSAFSLGYKAVQAAESQLGVPYIWGGATPGVGFDCSGLAMWAWAQAGVSLPHSAELQYMETTRVPMTDLQPGDLIFYASNGYVYHVIIYVGSGPYGSDTAAEETGTLISYTPILPDPYAAGQP